MANCFSERALIADIRKALPASVDGQLRMGIGDDCAVFSGREGLLNLVTTDTLVEGIHFDRAFHPPQLLAAKAVAVNMSDIAAMGGIPRYVLLSLAISAGLDCDWLTAFLAGFQQTVREYGAVLIGGDTVKSGHEFMVTVTVIGEVPSGQVCYRSGALVGDTVWVSGPLGQAAAGLYLLQRGMAEDEGQWPGLCQAHLRPRARISLGRALAQSARVHAMMDISDGLATDLAHLCAESGVAAEIDGKALPMTAELARAAKSAEIDPLDWVLRGGEDYQLLLTCAAEDGEFLHRLALEGGEGEIIRVGRIVQGKGVFLRQGDELVDISYQGYDHFR